MSIKPPIFIGGAGRSGTTLLRVILDSHPNIACGPELKIIPLIVQLYYECRTKYTEFLSNYLITADDTNRIFAQCITSLLEKYMLNSGKKRIAEKTPNNVYIFSHLYQMFPESPLIHIIRDGRDVIASLLSINWEDPNGNTIDYTRDIKKAAQYWVKAVTYGRKCCKEHGKNLSTYYEIRYEDLVAEPEKTLKKLFSVINEPWNPVVLRYYEQKQNLACELNAPQVTKKLYTSSMGRWKNDLTGEQKDEVKSIAGNLLIELGYTHDLDW